jgi:ATP-dependent Clp protease ATP-binding subunit ClpA
LHVSDAEVEAFVVATAPASPSSSDAPPFTVLATECIKQAVAEALQLAHNYVGTEHILLALFRQTDGLAAKALTQLGATHDGARARVIQRLSGYRAGA